MLEYIILGTLNSKSLTGYDIRKCIEDGVGMFFKASFGSIYPLLNRLLEKEYVMCKCNDDNKRNKKIYVITDQGKEAFDNWLLSSENELGSMEMFMAKVFFCDKLPKEISCNKINSYKMRLNDYLEELIERKKKYDRLTNQQDFYYKLSTLYFGICKLQSIIHWCDIVASQQELSVLIEKY